MLRVLSFVSIHTELTKFISRCEFPPVSIFIAWHILDIAFLLDFHLSVVFFVLDKVDALLVVQFGEPQFLIPEQERGHHVVVLQVTPFAGSLQNSHFVLFEHVFQNTLE